MNDLVARMVAPRGNRQAASHTDAYCVAQGLAARAQASSPCHDPFYMCSFAVPSSPRHGAALFFLRLGSSPPFSAATGGSLALTA
jgi:hypothetical protein